MNIPLRLALAELVVKLIQGDIGADQWQLVTSLVARDRLEEVFSDGPPQLQTTGEGNFSSNSRPAFSPTQSPVQPGSERNWQLDDPRLEEASIRQAWCSLQGLLKPTLL